jgi:hypothetical protein
MFACFSACPMGRRRPPRGGLVPPRRSSTAAMSRVEQGWHWQREKILWLVLALMGDPSESVTGAARSHARCTHAPEPWTELTTTAFSLTDTTRSSTRANAAALDGRPGSVLVPGALQSDLLMHSTHGCKRDPLVYFHEYSRDRDGDKSDSHGRRLEVDDERGRGAVLVTRISFVRPPSRVSI